MAAADEHHGAGRVRAAGRLGDEPRLADPRLPGDEHEPALAAARGVERREQPVALGVAADERRALAARGGERRWEGRSGSARGGLDIAGMGRAGRAGPHLRDQLARRRRRGDRQLGPQPLGEPPVRGDRGGAVAARREPRDQVAVRLLRQRLERHALAGAGDRGGMVAGGRGPLGQLGQQRAAGRALLVARHREPVARVEPGQQLAAPQRQRSLRPPGGRQRRRVGDVGRRVDEADVLARGDQASVRGRPERAAHVRERAAQARARGLVEHVRPEPRSQLAARVPARAQREVAQQRARRPSRGQREPAAVELDRQLAEDEHAQHRPDPNPPVASACVGAAPGPPARPPRPAAGPAAAAAARRRPPAWRRRSRGRDCRR